MCLRRKKNSCSFVVSELLTLGAIFSSSKGEESVKKQTAELNFDVDRGEKSDKSSGIEINDSGSEVEKKSHDFALNRSLIQL